MGPLLGAAILALGLAACGGGESDGSDGDAPSVAEQNQADARAAVNASARVLAAISEGDSALMRTAFAPTARVIANRGEGAEPAESDVDRNVAMVAANAGRYVERMWDPDIRLFPDSAVVSAPYDFYVDGEFSHCGVDVFTVAPVDGDLKVIHLAYTVEQPPACALHPAGPPSGM